MESLIRSSAFPLLVLWVSVSMCDCKVEMYGQVQSPLYPKPYPADLHKQWNLEVPHGYKIRLTFNYLDIEPSANCYYDSLMVLYGRKVLGKFCGQKSTDAHHPGHKSILSPGNRLQLAFVTDASNPGLQPHLGFSAFYQAIDVDECSSPVSSEDSGPLCSQICLNTLGSYQCACHHGYQLRGDGRTCVLNCGAGVFRESEGTLSSPGFPKSSPLGLDCTYNITVQPGFEVTLRFSDSFHVEQVFNQRSTCLFHWLLVTIPGQKPQKYCGEKSPGILHTGSNSVQLEYHTDSAGQSYGWSLDYTTQRVECKLDKSIGNGRVTPDFPEYFYRDYIQVRCDQGYKLMLGGKEIKSYKSMCQHNGKWHLPLPECKIIDCGDPRPLLNGGVRFLSGSDNEYGSLIQYHCNEPYYAFTAAHHVNFTCAADRKWRASDQNAVIPPCFPVCGRPTVDLNMRDRVLGGKAAPAGSFPWQVFLLAGGRGGAFVIGDRWLMTAAHNLEKISDYGDNVKVFVGDVSVTELVKLPSLPIASLHVHPGYKNNEMRTNFNNDIALIKLNSSITFDENVMPLCLPAQDTELEHSGLVSGFGLTETFHKANQLRYIQLPVVDQDLCHTFVETERAIHRNVAPLTANMFCAGFPEGGKDTCSGDSGSAFVMNNNGMYWAAGIVSWGVECGKAGKYGIYTRVSKYADWIKKTMEENQ
ncbi:complement C1r-A subcomponent-like isoform X1 [Salminus brasiliensis]|uniref:complement C1r-A subcomponent-like isoform X1 n=1 Tax=Salminus brasiliensis TaxID=930266 RepID=UPI003B8393DE